MATERLEPRTLLSVAPYTMPTGIAPPDNLVVNGSFELDVVTHSTKWNAFEPGTIQGWTIVRTGDIKAEIQRQGLKGWSASNGAQWLELDGDENGPGVAWDRKTKGRAEQGLYTIQQSVPVTAGKPYSLMFDFAARPGTKQVENQMSFRVLDSTGAAIVSETVTALPEQIVGGNAKPAWRTATTSFLAPDSGAVTIEFTGLGPDNTLGMFIDNVVAAPAKIRARLHDAGIVSEGPNSVARFKVELLDKPLQDVDIFYATKFDKKDNNTPLITASANDFQQTAAGDHIVIPAGQTEGVIEITVPASGEASEYSEEFMVVIANAPNGVIIPMSESQIVQNQSDDHTGLTRFTPTGRAQIKEHGLQNGWTGWAAGEAKERVEANSESLGYWRATEEQGAVTYTTPKGNPWSSDPGKNADLMNGEGPYLQTQSDVPYTDFRMTIQYATQDVEKHSPLVLSDRKDATLTWKARSENNEQYGNSGIYIFDRYEVQIIDPSAWGVGTGGAIAQAGKESLTPGGVYKLPEFQNVPADSDLEFDPNGNDAYGYKYNFVNRAKGTGEWNTLVIEFRAPKIEGGVITRPAHMTTWLNPDNPASPEVAALVFKGWVVDGAGKAIAGTGSRGTVTDKNPLLASGQIYLQSHWGSQVEFRPPTIATL